MTTATYNQIVEAIGRRKTYSINDNLDVYTTRRGKKREKSSASSGKRSTIRHRKNILKRVTKPGVKGVMFG